MMEVCEDKPDQDYTCESGSNIENFLVDLKFELWSIYEKFDIEARDPEVPPTFLTMNLEFS